MISVAAQLRRGTLAANQALSPEDRVVLAFRLGDTDAEILAAARGIGVADARRELDRQRQTGRRPSGCAGAR